MKAVAYHEYGPPDVLRLEEVERPAPGDDDVLVKVCAASVNASDYEFLTAVPAYVRMWGLRKPKFNILGSDIAGVVEAVGAKVTRFRPGDEVFGDIFELWGGFAEYVCAREKMLTLKPAGMTFEVAAALPQAAVIGLQGLRDKGRVQPGQQVLINGAGGGAGSFAVQIAKHLGAETTGVDSAGKLDTMREIGADHVIDYTREDFTASGKQYDLILDLAAHHSVFDYKRALGPKGIYLMVGGTVPRLLQLLTIGGLISLTGSRKMGLLMVVPNQGIDSVIELIEAGAITPLIDQVYPLDETAEAMRRVGEGHAKGKVVISV